MILVPDLATDLGTAERGLHRVDVRRSATASSGRPATRSPRRRSPSASAARWTRKTFPNGPGLYYSNPYFLGGDKYKGPYTEKDPNCEQAGRASTVERQRHHGQDVAAVPGLPLLRRVPGHGPDPARATASDPAKYRPHPLATGPYKIEEYTPRSR